MTKKSILQWRVVQRSGFWKLISLGQKTWTICAYSDSLSYKRSARVKYAFWYFMSQISEEVVWDEMVEGIK